MTSRVSEKGQVTIPKELRTRFGIQPGEEVEIREDDGRIVVEKVARPGRLDHLYGIVDLGMSTDAFMDELRGPAELP